MKKIQKYKTEAVEALKEFFSGCTDVVFADYRGLSVSQITVLRSKLREKGADFKVVKNNFAKIAMHELGMPDSASYLCGPTAIAGIKGDAGAVAKEILDFSRESAVKLKGAVVAGRVFGMEEVEALSKLPGKEQLIAMLMSTMNAPLQNLVYVINGVTTKLVRTLQAVADKKAS